MKKILITGENSYIGASFKNYIQTSFADRYTVETLGVKGDMWREADFSGYDAVFHVAGIAHVEPKNVSDAEKERYYTVNSKLAAEVAKKAKHDGAGQFLFMSSSIVYGDAAPVGKDKIITADTKPAPATVYGDSKLKAEQQIAPLCDEGFHVAIIRSPMVYGKDCRGNYPRLSRFAKKHSIFPDINNRRTMIYIGNLTEFVRLLIDNNESGLFFPANRETVNTSRMIREIGRVHGKKIVLVKGLSWAVGLMSSCSSTVRKAFGNLEYSKEITAYRDNYRLFDFEESIAAAEKG